MNTFLDRDPNQIINIKNPFESLFHLNTDAILIIDSKGNIKTGNASAFKLSGHSLTKIVGKNYLQLVDERDRKLAQECFHLSLQSIYKEYRINILSNDEQRIGCLMRFVPIQYVENSNYMFLVIKSMKDLDRIAAKYLESEMNFQIITENVQDVIILMNAKKEYIYISPSSKKVFAFDPINIPKEDEPFFNIHPDDVKLLEQQFNEAIENNEPFTVVLKALHVEKGWIWTELNGTPVYDKDHQFQHMVLVARDISIQKEQEEKLKRYAFQDPLTRLPNRRYFRNCINQSIDQLNNTNKVFGVIMLDIDDFKLINDQFGHEIGDEVICEFAHRIEQVIGKKGIAARLGGDEFIVLVYEVTSEKNLMQFIEELRKSIIECIIIDQLQIKVTSSIGATICTNHHENEAYFLKRADIALYQVKEKGKNQYHINYS